MERMQGETDSFLSEGYEDKVDIKKTELMFEIIFDLNHYSIDLYRLTDNERFFDALVDCSLRHINPCGLFNAKSCLYIYIRYLWFINE